MQKFENEHLVSKATKPNTQRRLWFNFPSKYKYHAYMTFLLESLVASYDSWFQVARAYFTGSMSHTRVRNTNVNFRVTKENAANLVFLAGVFRYVPHEDHHGSITFHFQDDFILNVNIKDLEEQYAVAMGLHQMALAVHYGVRLKKRNGELFLAEIEGMTWVCRKYSTDLGEVLLPICGEPYEYNQWFSRIVSSGKTFVDVGANLGGYAIRAAKMGANVIAIEPDFETFNLLLTNSELNNTRMLAQPVAAGEKRGRLPLFGGEGYEAITSLKNDDARLCVKQYVDVIPLNELVPSSIAKIDLLKIDVEGAERDVLEGSLSVLKKTKYLMLELRDQQILDWLRLKQFKVLDSARNWRNCHNFLFENQAS